MAKTPEIAVGGEEYESNEARVVGVRERSCLPVAQTLPVSEFFFTQLGPGRFEIDATNVFADEIVLSRMHVASLAAGIVVPDPAFVAIVVPLRCEGPYLFNGVALTATSFGLAGGRNGYHTHGKNRESITVGLSRSRFTSTIAALRGVDPDEIRLDDHVFNLPGPLAAQLRERLAAIVAHSSGQGRWSNSGPGGHSIKNEVYQLFVDAYLEAHVSAGDDARRVSRQREIVRRAEERFIAAGGQTVSLADLCAAAGVGRTTLQEAFHRLYGESPLCYFYKRRLMQGRETLILAPRGRAPVKRAALGAGFTTLGRFSVEYRRLFGESPSATLSETSA